MAWKHDSHVDIVIVDHFHDHKVIRQPRWHCLDQSGRSFSPVGQTMRQPRWHCLGDHVRSICCMKQTTVVCDKLAQNLRLLTTRQSARGFFRIRTLHMLQFVGVWCSPCLYLSVRHTLTTGWTEKLLSGIFRASSTVLVPGKGICLSEQERL